MSHIDIDLCRIASRAITLAIANEDSFKMRSELVHYLSPEEQDLAKRRAELAILQAELTDRELSLAGLRAELAAFEGRYLRDIGVLYAELDNWNAKIAELTAEAAGTEQAQTAASEARARAAESHAAAHGDASKVEDVTPSPELRKLYREVVNQIHPDRASSDSDRALRERLMKAANAAFRRGDAEVLRKVLEEYRHSPESVEGDGATADLERVVRQILRISKRLAEIEAEVVELTGSEIALLMAKVQTAAAKGRDLLAEIARDVQCRIDLACTEYETQSLRAKSR